MAFSLRLTSLSTRKTESTRQDSIIDLKLWSGKDPKQNFLVSIVELPNPQSPACISPHRKLLKKCYITHHPKSLHELVSSACQATCFMILQRSTLSSGTNLIVTDPAVVDLLLTCVNSVITKRWMRLLPGCPFTDHKIKETISGLPALSTFSTKSVPPTSTYSATPTSPWTRPDPLSSVSDNERSLLTWLLESPFSNLASVTASSHPLIHLPSLDYLGIKTFIPTQQPSNKESLFAHHCRRIPSLPPFPVFHGTHPSRLPLILSQGLKNMSGTRYQTNGRSNGKGIYLAEDASTSLYYSFGVSAWKGSEYREGKARVLLCCELAGHKRGKRTYVVPDEGKVIVRFVLLVPASCTVDPGPEVRQDLERAFRVLRGMRGDEMGTRLV
ncbi:hypothetical protein K469DRAFT_745801 [Zopfia rhizophila CBS 207.26]|uniref:PARP catalytic domain-containing protein n=1 Tax=Zopfia rhizophila CBS 207.26 TaxID=1314779 RepID=A0A6A6EJM7_9PEZI|nr:hypothetical protein K469DRAFT_745801 [Zopfia rhizophila CBS 207.26]